MSRKFALAACLLLIAALSVAAAPVRSARVSLAISGMYCEGCATGIRAMLQRTAGVVKATVSFERKEAVVEYDAAKTSPGKIIEAVEKMGYKASSAK